MLRPVFDNVILKKIELEKSTSSGILLNASNLENDANVGEVYAIGDSSVLSIENAGELKLGDKVIFSDEFKKISYKGETYYIVNEEEILAILN